MATVVATYPTGLSKRSPSIASSEASGPPLRPRSPRAPGTSLQYARASTSSSPQASPSTAFSSLGKSLEPPRETPSSSSLPITNRLAPALSSNPYREPLPLPGYKGTPMIYVYRFAPIGQLHHERGRQLAKIFFDNISVSKVKTRKKRFLRELQSSIAFEVKACGPSACNSRPSMLAICTTEVFSALKHVLTRDHVRSQYSRCSKSSMPAFSKLTNGLFGQKGNVSEDFPWPEFDLHFWTDPKSSITLLWSHADASLLSGKQTQSDFNLETVALSAFTMCGSRVVPKSNDSGLAPSSSTLGCLIEVESELYGLTSAHVFTEGLNKVPPVSNDMPQARSPQKETKDSEGLCTEQDSDDDDDVIFDDDEDYELLSDEDDDLQEASNENPRNSHNAFEDIRAEELKKQMQDPNNDCTVLIPDSRDCAADKSDLDWAVLKMDRPCQQLPNAYIAKGGAARLQYFSTMASEHPGRVTKVLVISSFDKPKQGLLLPGSSFLGGKSGRGPCEVWNVSMHDANDIAKGDSGAIVLDALTQVVYGHVVASNPLQELHLIPMSATVKQMQAVFQVEDVRLPDPFPMLERLAVFYHESNQYAKATRAVLALSELPQFTGVHRLLLPIFWEMPSWETIVTGDVPSRTDSTPIVHHDLSPQWARDTVLLLDMADLWMLQLLQEETSCTSRRALSPDVSDICRSLLHYLNLRQQLRHTTCYRVATPSARQLNRSFGFRGAPVPVEILRHLNDSDSDGLGPRGQRGASSAHLFFVLVTVDSSYAGCQQNPVYSNVGTGPVRTRITTKRSIPTAPVASPSSLSTHAPKPRVSSYQDFHNAYKRLQNKPNMISQDITLATTRIMNLDSCMRADAPATASFSLWLFRQLNGVFLEWQQRLSSGGKPASRYTDIVPSNIYFAGSKDGLPVMPFLRYLPSRPSKEDTRAYETIMTPARAMELYLVLNLEAPLPESVPIWSLSFLLLEVCVWLAFGAKQRNEFLGDFQGEFLDVFYLKKRPHESFATLVTMISVWLQRLEAGYHPSHPSLQAIAQFLEKGRLFDLYAQRRWTLTAIRNQLGAILESKGMHAVLRASEAIPSGRVLAKTNPPKFHWRTTGARTMKEIRGRASVKAWVREQSSQVPKGMIQTV